MLIEIERTKMREKKIKCDKCGNFICSTGSDGYIRFRKNLAVNSNGKEFKVSCGCGDTTIIVLK